MVEEKNKGKGKKTLIIAGGIVLTAVGFIVIPPLLDKYANKAYKFSLKKEKIDFEVEEKIEKVLNRVRPYLQNDGGDVEFIKYENGVCYVRLTGACSDCPLIDNTLDSGIETALVNEIPEIIKVVNVN